MPSDYQIGEKLNIRVFRNFHARSRLDFFDARAQHIKKIQNLQVKKLTKSLKLTLIKNAIVLFVRVTDVEPTKILEF